jgi:hypothetical protein
MTTVRKFVYAALLAASALSCTPSAMAAEEPAQGKFTLLHDVHWGNALVPAGDYEFSYDPYQPSAVLTLTKLSSARAGFMVLVTSAEPSKSSDSNQLLLETVAEGKYVSAMQLAACGVTLHFMVPSHPLKQMAKVTPTHAPSGQ